MGKRIISQRRGRGTTRYRNHGHSSKGSVSYPVVSKELLHGEIVDLVHCPNHTAPLAYVLFENGEKGLALASEQLRVGAVVAVGSGAPAVSGNVLPLSEIPEGTLVHDLELRPGDGGKLVRSSGVFARVVSTSADKVLVKLPSKKIKAFHPQCRATLGIVAGGGRLDKPVVKAGKRWHAARATGKLFPRTSAVAMNAVDHPFGSGRGRHAGKSTIAPRHAPPGRKVGQIRARRTGKKK